MELCVGTGAVTESAAVHRGTARVHHHQLLLAPSSSSPSLCPARHPVPSIKQALNAPASTPAWMRTAWQRHFGHRPGHLSVQGIEELSEKRKINRPQPHKGISCWVLYFGTCVILIGLNTRNTALLTAFLKYHEWIYGVKFRQMLLNAAIRSCGWKGTEEQTVPWSALGVPWQSNNLAWKYLFLSIEKHTRQVSRRGVFSKVEREDSGGR